MKVLNYGSLNVDYVYSVDHIIVGGETQHSSKLEVFSGGKGLNQSIALAKAGVPVYHAGIVGETSLLSFATIEGKPQKIKCFRFTFSSCSTILLCKSPKFN